MARKSIIEEKVTHQEMIHYAIVYMSKKCEEHIELCGGDIGKAKDMFAVYFSKLRLMCEAYKIETGDEYELRAGCSIDLSDLY